MCNGGATQTSPNVTLLQLHVPRRSAWPSTAITAHTFMGQLIYGGNELAIANSLASAFLTGGLGAKQRKKSNTEKQKTMSMRIRILHRPFAMCSVRHGRLTLRTRGPVPLGRRIEAKHCSIRTAKLCINPNQRHWRGEDCCMAPEVHCRNIQP